MSKICYICNTDKHTKLITEEREFQLSRYDFSIKYTDTFYRCIKCREEWYEAGMLDKANLSMIEAIPEDKILQRLSRKPLISIKGMKAYLDPKIF